ncbi:MAG: zinc/iron-chelating domain-containing protein [Bdellovibrionaceae bacterium]|nr:zinc/iron-chelating domain-containing protein [Pseudobdellovibrionaceae bacterium]
MSKNFYKDGLRFECQGSGKCCTSRGSYGFVYLTLKDRKRMARVLGLNTSVFTRKYCSKTDGHFHLKETSGDCRFLNLNRCEIYEGRPDQCRTWPFWPENMNSKTWNQEVKSYCPGIGKGKLFTKEEIEAQLRESEI